MIGFTTIKADRVFMQIQDVVRASFKLCQSAQDVANAIRAIFAAGPIAGTTTLTLGTTAPDSVFSTTPTGFTEFTDPDGHRSIMPYWRVS